MYSAAVKTIGRFIKSLSILLLLILLGSGIGCRSVDPVVKIGLVAPFEGRQRDIGYDVLYSARLAVRQMNAAGGIDGTRVALVALDDGGRQDLAQATAQSLVIDPAVVAVVGHWLPQTTSAAQSIYQKSDLLLLPGGQDPYPADDPSLLSPQFIADYEQVTPFDEVPGPYAGAAYNAFQDLFAVMQQSAQDYGQINRQTVKAVYLQRQ